MISKNRKRISYVLKLIVIVSAAAGTLMSAGRRDPAEKRDLGAPSAG